MPLRDPRIPRRTFLGEAGLLAGGVALGATLPDYAPAAPTPGALPTRLLGKTGVPLTVLTLGTAPCGFAQPHSPANVADCVRAAIEQGIGAVDTAPAYDVAEEGVGMGLGRQRKEIFLSTKVLADTVANAEKSLSNSFRKLKTDYVDLVYFHNLGERKVDVAMNPDGVFTWLLKQKKAGKARFVGVSGHHRPGRFQAFLDSGEVDVVLVVVNFVDRHTYNFEEKVLTAARKHNVGIVAMKVFGGALGMDYSRPERGPQLDVKYLELAMRYAVDTPGVATLNIGVNNAEQVRKNVAMARNLRPLSADERAECLALGKKLAGQWGLHFGPLALAPSPRRKVC